MTKKEQQKLDRQRAREFAMLVTGQTHSHVGIIAGDGKGVSKEFLLKPRRVFDGVPVYHVCANLFDLGRVAPVSKKRYKFGNYYNPCVLLPDTGARFKVHVDTNIKGWYVLITTGKLDDWDLDYTYWVKELICWTPKVKGDSVVKAGYRMLRAVFLENLYTPADRLYVDTSGQFGVDWYKDWYKEWECDARCWQVMASVCPTLYKDEQHFQEVYNNAPDELKEHLVAMSVFS